MKRFRRQRTQRRVATKRQADISDEIRFYLELRAQEFEAQGLSPDAAARAAREAFGHVTDIEKACADIHREPRTSRANHIMQGILRDIQFTWRAVGRSPAFYLTAVLTAGLGIGANTAIFSIFNWAYLGHAPGVVAADELRTLRLTSESNAAIPWTNRAYETLRDGMRTLDQLVGFEGFSMHVSTGPGARAERLSGEVVAGDYFGTLGLVPAYGRFFSPEELRVPGQHPVVVVSLAFWSRHFGPEAAFDNATVTINGAPFTIVGVAPRGFRGAIKPGTADLWVPVMMHNIVLPTYPANTLESTQAGVFFQLLGRRVGNVASEAIRQEATAIRAAARPERPALANGWAVRVDHGAAPFSWNTEQMRRIYQLMSVVVVLVLLIACANIANLLLARATARRQELAVQLALGVSRGGIFRRYLVEALTIATAGAGTGLLVATWTIALFRGSTMGTASLARMLPALGDFQFDQRVLWFTIGLTVVTALLGGTLPAIIAARQDPAGALRSGGRGGPSGAGVRSVLAGAQVAVLMVLLISAGLFLRTIRNLGDIRYGFDAENVLTFTIDPGTNGYPPEQILPFYRDLLGQLKREAGTASVTIAWRNVFGWMGGGTRLQDPSRHAADEFPIDADLNTIGPDYFTTVGIDLIEGRGFTDAEAFTRGARTLVVNQALAAVLAPNQSVIGRTVRLRYPDDEFEIIGVVEDVQLSDPIDPPEPMVFAALAYAWYPTWATISVRGIEPGSAAQALEVVRRADPTLPVYDVASIAEMADGRFGEERFVAKLTGFFAALALALALIGLYGVVSYSVTTRMREMGIRFALGARTDTVVALVLRRAFLVAGVGALAGVGAALVLAQAVRARLYGVDPVDPLTVLVAALTLGLGVLAASALPVRRAARVDPVTVLRVE